MFLLLDSCNSITHYEDIPFRLILRSCETKSATDSRLHLINPSDISPSYHIFLLPAVSKDPSPAVNSSPILRSSRNIFWVLPVPAQSTACPLRYGRSCLLLLPTQGSLCRLVISLAASQGPKIFGQIYIDSFGLRVEPSHLLA